MPWAEPSTPRQACKSPWHELYNKGPATYKCRSPIHAHLYATYLQEQHRFLFCEMGKGRSNSVIFPAFMHDSHYVRSRTYHKGCAASLGDVDVVVHFGTIEEIGMPYLRCVHVENMGTFDSVSTFVTCMITYACSALRRFYCLCHAALFSNTSMKKKTRSRLAADGDMADKHPTTVIARKLSPRRTSPR